MLRPAWLLLLFAGTFLTLAPAPVPAEEPRQRPNVLFIAIDDLNTWVGHLGGHPQVRTPNLDRLAARGVTFTRAYCAAPACNPSRAALLSGKRPSTTGIYHNDQPWEPVLRDTVTLPQYFKQNGYHVAAGGKIFHGGGGKDTDRYWHTYFRSPGSPRPSVPSVSGLNRAHFDWGPVQEGPDSMSDYKLVDWAVGQLQAKHDRPLFLAVGFVKPHLPWYVPQKYFDLYPLDKIILPTVKDDDLADVPPAGVRIAKPQGDHAAVVKANQWKHAVQGYLATITFTDDQIGRLLDGLDRSPLAKDTVVILWGDHGWHLGEKHHWRKFALWEEATHSPLIVSAPGLTRTGGRCDRTVDFLTIYPTLTDLCGLTTPKWVEGRSLRPLLADPAAAWDQPAVTTHGKGNHAVRTERWRYIRYEDGSEELYDHRADPHEWTNLAGKPELAGVKKELASRIPPRDAPNAPRGAGGDN